MAAATSVLSALGGWSVYKQTATSAGPVSLPFVISLPSGAERAGRMATLGAFGFLTASLVFRAIEAERPPLGNLWEYTVALGWGMLLFTLIFEAAFKERSLGLAMLPGALTMMAIALVFFPSELRPLVPALQANRILGIHVATMTLAYSALSVSFGASLLYLLQRGGDGRRFARLPDRETLGEISYWSVLVGFPLLTLGVALGAYWANSAWGRYWGWDPKETASLITWLVYAGYLHAKGLRSWDGTRAALLLIAGFGAIMFTYFAVNFVFSGLHSYAGV